MLDKFARNKNKLKISEIIILIKWRERKHFVSSSNSFILQAQAQQA